MDPGETAESAVQELLGAGLTPYCRSSSGRSREDRGVRAASVP